MAFTPTDPTKAEVRVVGEAPNQQLDFYIPRGARGEPGGWVTNNLSTGTDLNTILSPGLYVDALGGMSNGAGGLGVYSVYFRGASRLTQVWHPAENTATDGRIFRSRALTNSGWSPWRTYASTRVDQTAGRAIYQWDDLNGREQLIYGDTGLRSIKDSVISANGWDAAGSTNVYIRRVGQTVELRFDVYNLNTSTGAHSNGEFLTIPAGFRSTLGGAHTDFVCYSEPTGGVTISPLIGRSNVGTLTFLLAGRAPASIRFVRGGVTWTTNEPWPTTLPGTAVGTIPNT